MNRGLRLASHSSLLSCVVSTSVLLLAFDAVAQDPQAPPTVGDAEAGPIQENQTVAAEVEEAAKRVEGWNPGVSFGAGFNLVDNRSVVGQQDGTTLTLSGGIDGVLDFNHGMHEWRNGLLASAGVARTPSLGEFVKTNDGLSFESIYLLHVIEIFGPFARFGLNTQMFSANDVQPSAVDYVVSNLDGTVDNFTGRRLALTDPFQPLNLRQSLGVFVQPVREQEIELEARAGLGAMETFAEGGLAINDDDATPEVEVNELDDSYLVGGEIVVNAWGFLDPGKRISYSVGGSVLLPFVTSDRPDGQSLIDATTVEARAGLNVKLFDWASLNYKLAVLRQPLLVENVQISNNLLITIGAAFGSKAPAEEEPPPPCDCEDKPADGTAADGAEAGAEGAEGGMDVEGEAGTDTDADTETDAGTDAPPPAPPPPAPPPPEPAPEAEPAPAPQPEPAPEPNP